MLIRGRLFVCRKYDPRKLVKGELRETSIQSEGAHGVRRVGDNVDIGL